MIKGAEQAFFALFMIGKRTIEEKLNYRCELSKRDIDSPRERETERTVSSLINLLYRPWHFSSLSMFDDFSTFSFHTILQCNSLKIFLRLMNELMPTHIKAICFRLDGKVDQQFSGTRAYFASWTITFSSSVDSGQITTFSTKCFKTCNAIQSLLFHSPSQLIQLELSVFQDHQFGQLCRSTFSRFAAPARHNGRRELRMHHQAGFSPLAYNAATSEPMELIF
jgi:hypothetical protein